ncbi:MAG: hypothetical protein AVDCRST_MAG08-3467, partial [uncultured Acetobacteraceae bacterium]
ALLGGSLARPPRRNARRRGVPGQADHHRVALLAGQRGGRLCPRLGRAHGARPRPERRGDEPRRRLRRGRDALGSGQPGRRPHDRPHAHDGDRRAAAPRPESRHRAGELRAGLRHERERHRRGGARRQPGARPARAGGPGPRTPALLRQRRPQLPAAARRVARATRRRQPGLHARPLPGRPAAPERVAGRAPRFLFHRRRLRQRTDRLRPPAADRRVLAPPPPGLPQRADRPRAGPGRRAVQPSGHLRAPRHAGAGARPLGGGVPHRAGGPHLPPRRRQQPRGGELHAEGRLRAHGAGRVRQLRPPPARPRRAGGV